MFGDRCEERGNMSQFAQAPSDALRQEETLRRLLESLKSDSSDEVWQAAVKIGQDFGSRRALLIQFGVIPALVDAVRRAVPGAEWAVWSLQEIAEKNSEGALEVAKHAVTAVPALCAMLGRSELQSGLKGDVAQILALTALNGDKQTIKCILECDAVPPLLEMGRSDSMVFDFSARKLFDLLTDGSEGIPDLFGSRKTVSALMDFLKFKSRDRYLSSSTARLLANLKNPRAIPALNHAAGRKLVRRAVSNRAIAAVKEGCLSRIPEAKREEASLSLERLEHITTPALQRRQIETETAKIAELMGVKDL